MDFDRENFVKLEEDSGCRARAGCCKGMIWMINGRRRVSLSRRKWKGSRNPKKRMGDKRI